MPVGALMRPVGHVEPVDSMALAIARLRESAEGVIAVTEGGQFAGVITEQSLLGAIAQGIDPTESCLAVRVDSAVIRPYQTGAEALRLFDSSGAGALIVCDDTGRVVGVVVPTDLVPRRRLPIKPNAVGGMATPFGVYLTTGAVHAGAPWYAVVTTGMALFTMLFAAQTIGWWGGDWLAYYHAPELALSAFTSVVPLALFLVFMRLSPIAGTHGAEHQVVNAIEREEELVPAVVRRMSRVHPRCGTNFAAAVTLFLSIATWERIPDVELRTLLGVVVTISFWRPLGTFLQRYVTTKKPSEKQLEGGIRAGKALLERSQTASRTVPTVPLRIWNSGMLQVVLGACIALGIIAGFAAIFHLDLGLS